jgi:hypothetical protein
VWHNIIDDTSGQQAEVCYQKFNCPFDTGPFSRRLIGFIISSSPPWGMRSLCSVWPGQVCFQGTYLSFRNFLVPVRLKQCELAPAHQWEHVRIWYALMTYCIHNAILRTIRGNPTQPGDRLSRLRCFRGCSQSVQANVGTVSQVRHPQLPSTSFQIHS